MIFFIYSFSALLVSYTLSLLAALPISPHLPFLVAAALAGITLVLSASLLRETRPPGSNGSHRSEEHTSELQSRGHLVCRLLLEKKTIYTYDTNILTEYSI